jgi:hypothetical protein
MRLGRFIGRRPSIYEHIRAHLTDAGVGAEGQTLPDEDEIAGESDLRWAPGALEGAFSRHAGPEDDEALVADVHAALVELADRPGGRSRARARGTFRQAEPRTHVDGVLARLEAFPPRNLDRLYAEVREIAVESGRREEVKFALAVLGGFGRDEDADLLRTFARHEEFTLYAAIALANVVEDPTAEWLQLARQVDGWGRIEPRRRPRARLTSRSARERRPWSASAFTTRPHERHVRRRRARAPARKTTSAAAASAASTAHEWRSASERVSGGGSNAAFTRSGPSTPGASSVRGSGGGKRANS